MPRKNPVPKKEIEICKRLREFRLRTRLSQVAFASEIGIDAARLASYEHARVPIKYALAWRMNERFQLSPRWLATGEGSCIADLEPVAALPPPEVETGPGEPVSGNELFSEVYERLLKLSEPRESLTLNLHSSAQVRALEMQQFIEIKLMEWFALVPDSHFRTFYEKLREQGELLFQSFPKDSINISGPRYTELVNLFAKFSSPSSAKPKKAKSPNRKKREP